MEPEKRKIGFWSEPMIINDTIAARRPDKPFTKKVAAKVRCAYPAHRLTSIPSTQGMQVYALAASISSLLVEHGYIKAERQITKMEIEKLESERPGFVFFMQEVE